MSTKYTAFRCPQDILQAAKQRAKAERRSLSNYIICLLEDHLGPEIKAKGAGKAAKAKRN